MLIAQRVKTAFDGATAFTLYGSYAVMPDGNRVLVPLAACSQERRNDFGRCTHLLATYADGSQLRFRYSASRGTSLEVIAPHKES